MFKGADNRRASNPDNSIGNGGCDPACDPHSVSGPDSSGWESARWDSADLDSSSRDSSDRESPPRFKRKRFIKLAILLLITTIGGGWLILRFLPIPGLDQFLTRTYSTAYYDRSGELLWVSPATEEGLRREYLPIDSIPPVVRDMFVLSEDKRFRIHPGIDPIAIFRSLFLLLKTGDVVSGASTISMQLARLILREGGRSIFPHTSGSSVDDQSTVVQPGFSNNNRSALHVPGLTNNGLPDSPDYIRSIEPDQPQPLDNSRPVKPGHPHFPNNRLSVGASQSDLSHNGQSAGRDQPDLPNNSRVINPGRQHLSNRSRPDYGNIREKIREMLYAVALEARFSKRQILELWLNALPFGFQVQGVQTASRTFFSNPVSALTPAQAVLLSVIPRSPAYYNVFLHPDHCRQAARQLIDNHDLSISERELHDTIASVQSLNWNNKAPHFIKVYERLDRSQPVLRDRLIPERSPIVRSSEDRVLPSNRTVQTSLDLELTSFLRERLSYYLDLKGEHRLTNGAGIVVDNKTGEILAYVGSKDFYSHETGSQIDAAQITLQPGSCVKPFLYAYAIENGYLPNTILPDIPLSFGDSEVYEPLNFNNRFNGPVRLRIALASSLNVPAVYLLNDLGISGFLDFLVNLGFSSLQPQRDEVGLGLALGNGNVSLFELVRGFTLFPRRGAPMTYTCTIEESETTEDRVSETETGRHSSRIISPYTADIICDILSDNHSRFLGFDNARVFTLDFPVMFKTGTADQFQNIWALAASVEYTIGIWLGNVSGETVQGVTGSSLPAAIAGEVLSYIYGTKDSKPGDFPHPYGSRLVTVCTLSGKLPNETCTHTVDEYIPTDRIIGTCDYHVRHGHGGSVVFPPLYSQWMGESGLRKEEIEQVSEELSILYPKDGAVFYLDPSGPKEDQAVAIKAAGTSGNVRVFVNGQFMETITAPLRWFLQMERGEWEVVFRSDDTEDTVKVIIK